MSPRNPSELTNAIKQESLRLGFHAVGITSTSALERRRNELLQWIQAGHAGEMSYMQNFVERQATLLKRLPNIKSVIILAAGYGENQPTISPDTSVPTVETAFGRVARYAKGRDYHRAIAKRLKKLEAFIQDQAGPEQQTIRCVDTNAIQERALAESAGLGFIGKNTCLIMPKGGSYFFLAGLLTSLELVPDAPISWDCGACNLCIEACPTDALWQPFELDARRCIAYLTIEHKGTIDPELRPLMGNWLFGCDICQEVCPYNKPAAKSPIWIEFQAASGVGTQLPLEKVFACQTDAQFENQFAGTPLMRAKRAGLLRNARIVAANLK